MAQSDAKTELVALLLDELAMTLELYERDETMWLEDTVNAVRRASDYLAEAGHQIPLSAGHVISRRDPNWGSKPHV